MSVLTDRMVACPGCGVAVQRTVAKSVNLRRSPDLRAQLLEGTFQLFVCGTCGSRHVVDDPFICFDYDLGDWIATYPLAQEARFAAYEDDIERLAGWALGPTAPPAAHLAAKATRLRTAFGLASLREKLVCFDNGLDDVALELTKLDILVDAGELPVGDVRLRLVTVERQRLVFAATRRNTQRDEIPLGTVSAPRSAYEIASSGRSNIWEEAVDVLSDGTYVDLSRLGAPRRRADISVANNP